MNRVIPSSLEKFLAVRAIDEDQAAEIIETYKRTGHVEIYGSAWGEKPKASRPKDTPAEPVTAPTKSVPAPGMPTIADVEPVSEESRYDGVMMVTVNY
ncbi:hypothetical protein [Thalassoroseus pseudoceratinae]|uniref:hypothetical protein n=1 Tax=Thalassoroseus pseudoceratinae TaxID=2713176 RepID=UPI00141D89B5|nr:hypothetical protein [Thalassoroseus pseudoceratinae]